MIARQFGARKLSVILNSVALSLRKKPLSIGALVDKLGQRGPLLIALLLALPFPIPGPLPGLGVIFVPVIAFLGLSIVYRSLRWPEKGLLSRPIGGEVVGGILSAGAIFLEKIESRSKNRLAFLTKGFWPTRILGFSIAFCGILLALPLPPGTNSPPAMSIILLALSGLTRDGLLALIGYGSLAANITFFVALAWFGREVYDYIAAWF